MIEVLKGFPEKVLALTCMGHVTKRDYETVLIPTVQEALQQQGRSASITRLAPTFQESNPVRFGRISRLGWNSFFAGSASPWLPTLIGFGTRFTPSVS